MYKVDFIYRNQLNLVNKRNPLDVCSIPMEYLELPQYKRFKFTLRFWWALIAHKIKYEWKSQA